MNKQVKYILIILLALLALYWLQKPDDKLHLVFCDVGQGDAVLIIHGSSQILIDGGPDESVLSCLSGHVPFWDRKIEMVLLTHPDTDHFYGLIGVVERYKVNKFIANPFIIGGNSDLKSLASLLNQKNVSFYNPSQGDVIKLGEINLDILWPDERRVREIKDMEELANDKIGDFLVFENNLIDSNKYSIVAHLKYSDFDALLTGDLPQEESQLLFWQKRLFPVEVLKASHHGSKKDNPQELYEGTKPKLVVFSVGKNSFGHPDQDLIGRLTEEGINYRRTDDGGDVEVVTDGKDWRVLAN